MKNEQFYAELSLEQKLVFDKVVFGGENCFFTGQAGTGKSFLQRAMIKGLTRLFSKEVVAVTSLTGIAALNIQGQTIHSLTGASTVDNWSSSIQENEDKVFGRSRKNPQICKRIKDLKVLFVDEVSMFAHPFFDAMDLFFKKVRGSLELFGGIHLVLCGDFMQLPPVSRGEPQYLFNSPAFQSIECKMQLTRCFRQSDETFINVLNKIRNGTVDQYVINTLQSRITNEKDINELQRIETQRKLEKFKEDMKKLDTEQTKLRASLTHKPPKASDTVTQITIMKKRMADLRKIQEICFKRDNTQFEPPTFPVRLYPVNTYVTSHNENSLKQHNTQVYCLTGVDTGQYNQERPEKQIFVSEGCQVMVNRNVDLQAGVCNGTLATVKRIVFQPGGEKRIKDYVELDVVRNNVTVVLSIANDLGETTYRLERVKCEQLNALGNANATREQIPLQLAYAISIHKSQGLTLNKAIISIDRVFASGQAYVALSRLKDLKGLTLTSFNAERIRCDQSCVKFHQDLSTDGALEQQFSVFLKEGSLVKQQRVGPGSQPTSSSSSAKITLFADVQFKRIAAQSQRHVREASEELCLPETVAEECEESSEATQLSSQKQTQPAAEREQTPPGAEPSSTDTVISISSSPEPQLSERDKKLVPTTPNIPTPQKQQHQQTLGEVRQTPRQKDPILEEPRVFFDEQLYLAALYRMRPDLAGK